MPQIKAIPTGLAAAADGRERILHSAQELFARRGYHGVSISDVAQAAGVVKSAIYHHFESKEALYLAVLNETCAASRERMTSGARGDNWATRLRGAVSVLAELVGPRSHVLSLIMGGMALSAVEVSPANAEAIARLRREFVSALTREIAAGIDAGELRPIDPELGSLCLIGLVAAALQASPHAVSESNVDAALELFLRGAAVDARALVQDKSKLASGH